MILVIQNIIILITIKKNKTIIFVTHRISSLSYCDKIFEVQNNEIKEIKKYQNFD